MGITIELWRVRIGAFVHPRNGRSKLQDHNINARFSYVSLCIRLCLFLLLIGQCVERNPGPGPCGVRTRRGSQHQSVDNTRASGRVQHSQSGPSREIRSQSQDNTINQPVQQHDEFVNTQTSIDSWLMPGAQGEYDMATESDPGNSDSDKGTGTTDTTSLLLEIRHDVKRMNKKFDSLEKTVCSLKQDNKMLKEQNTKLTNEVKVLNTKLNRVEDSLSTATKKQTMLEKQSKRRNIKVYNVPEVGHETPTDTEQVVLSTVNKGLDLDVADTSLDCAYRLATKTFSRPILVQCTTTKVKERILEAFRTKRKGNSNLPFRIGEDLPESIAKARSRLYPFFKECIDAGKKTFYKNDYLLVDGEKYVYDETLKKPVPERK